MPDRTSEPPPIEIVDEGGCSEILIDRLVGVDVTGGVARLSLATDRTEPRTQQMRAVVTVRLACSLPALVRLHDALGNMRAQLERAGMLSRPPAPQSRMNGNGGAPAAASTGIAPDPPRKKRPRRGRGE
jgi:hypothetical protein